MKVHELKTSRKSNSDPEVAKSEEKHTKASQRASARRKRKYSHAELEKSNSRQSKRLHKGSALIGKKVTIQEGRNKGERGYVTRGANGYYCVQIEGGGTCWKRASSLHESANSAILSSGSEPRRDSQRRRSGIQDSWMSRHVKVKAGKHCGSTGIILSSGHGYYCVDIDEVGQVMIRGSQLDLLENENPECESETMSTMVAETESQRSVADVRDDDRNTTEDSADPCIGFAARVLVGMLSGMTSLEDFSSVASAASSGTDTEDDGMTEHETYEIQTYSPKPSPSEPLPRNEKTRFMTEVNTPLHGASLGSGARFDWKLSNAEKSAVDLTSFAW